MEFLGHVGGMGIDMEVSKTTQKVLTKQGLKFMLNTKVTQAMQTGSSIQVTVEDSKGTKTVSVILSQISVLRLNVVVLLHLF